MKVLLVSDLHHRLRQFDWLRRAAAGVDVVAIAGDLLDVRSPVRRGPAAALGVGAPHPAGR